MNSAVYRVVKRREETGTGDVVSLRLRPAPGVSPIGIEPGQFNLLSLNDGVEIPAVLSGREDDGVLMHTIRAEDESHRALIRLAEGDELQIRGPFGSAWPLDRARGKSVVLVAGGLGISALRPLIVEIYRNHQAYRGLHLLYGMRHPEDILYRDEIIAWERRPFMDVQITVDFGGPSWRGHVGVVNHLIRKLRLSGSDTVAFICGPELMMRYAVLALKAQDLPDDQLLLSFARTFPHVQGLPQPCPLGPDIDCRQGPVFRFDQIQSWMRQRDRPN
ncbi:MAG: FAD/NAD(P)-binding protein [Pseudomonadota bacterium]|nr:FAD/NAD(P)-binding protein [Pseudomonadota bacterium]